MLYFLRKKKSKLILWEEVTNSIPYLSYPLCAGLSFHLSTLWASQGSSELCQRRRTNMSSFHIHTQGSKTEYRSSSTTPGQVKEGNAVHSSPGRSKGCNGLTLRGPQPVLEYIAGKNPYWYLHTVIINYFLFHLLLFKNLLNPIFSP